VRRYVDSVKACYDLSVGYQTPFISGKDSMFNDFKGYNEKRETVAISIPPTLVVSAISVIPDINKTVSPEFKFVGDVIYILGDTNNELGASEYFKQLSKGDIRRIGKNVPKVNIQRNLKLYQIVELVIEKGLLASSISVHSGGLALALGKACLGGAVGVNLNIKSLKSEALMDYQALFSESQGRIVVSVSQKNIKVFEQFMKGISVSKIGRITKNKKLIITGLNNKKIIDIKISEIAKSYNKFSSNI